MTAGESCAHAQALTPGAVSIPGDYDGDGIINLGVWIDGWWYIMGSRAGGTTAGFSSQGAVRTPMDFDGDGITDIAFFVPERRE